MDVASACVRHEHAKGFHTIGPQGQRAEIDGLSTRSPASETRVSYPQISLISLTLTGLPHIKTGQARNLSATI